MERQQCEDCKYELFDAETEPCNTCVATDFHTFSHFTPKKDINQLLREKLGYVEPPKPDAVQQPSHYMLKPGLEVRDVLELLVNKIHVSGVGLNLFTSDYVQMMQYLMRFMDKNGKQDLEKARYYLDKLIEAYE